MRFGRGRSSFDWYEDPVQILDSIANDLPLVGLPESFDDHRHRIDLDPGDLVDLILGCGLDQFREELKGTAFLQEQVKQFLLHLDAKCLGELHIIDDSSFDESPAEEHSGFFLIFSRLQ